MKYIISFYVFYFRTVLDFPEGCEQSWESFYVPHTDVAL